MALMLQLGASDDIDMSKDQRTNFARNLDEVLTRRKKEVTARAIAAKAGIGETDLSDIRRGKREPSVDLAARIARALDVSLDALARTPGADEVRDPFGPLAERRSEPRDEANTGGR